MRCLPSEEDYTCVTPTRNLAEQAVLCLLLCIMTSSLDRFLRIDSITRPTSYRPQSPKNRRALLVRGGRFGGCDAKTLTSKPYHPMNLPEIHHISPLQILSKSPLFFAQLCLGHLSRLHLRKRHTSDCEVNCAIVIGVRNS